jgi:hypothetical protein
METADATPYIPQPTPAPSRQVVVPSGSPYTWTNSELWPQLVIVAGGTVTTIEISIDGATWDTVGLLGGLFWLYPTMRLRITYVLAPTVRVITI